MGTQTTGDSYSYNATTGVVADGTDGILELNLYPGGGAGQLPPGNFGTVDIGSPNNSTADLTRQILYGISEDDLAYFGGTFELGVDGTIQIKAMARTLIELPLSKLDSQAISGWRRFSGMWPRKARLRNCSKGISMSSSWSRAVRTPFTSLEVR